MNVGCTVLVVDDNLPICEYLQEVLTSAEYNVLCAQDGAEALAVLDAQDVDLAVIDLLLPGSISGDDVVVRALGNGVKVITMSGALTSDTRGRDLSHHHLQKPFRGPALLAAIERVLGDGQPKRRG
jgi:DNA-binding response OmpR family regulator